MDALLVLFLPFLLYPFWGYFAFVYVSRIVIKRLLLRHGTSQTIKLSFFILAALFLPIMVTSKGGNIPAIYPCWLALLGRFMPAGVDITIGSFVVAAPFVPLIWKYVSKEVGRQSIDKRRVPQIKADSQGV